MHIHNHPLIEGTRDVELVFFFGGKPLKAKVGQTVAAALMANGIKQFGVSRKLQQPRGLFCNNGRCCSCFVSIEGMDHVLSCMTIVEEGMDVTFNDGDPVVRRGRLGS